MTQENDVKRPIQELEHDPIQKIKTQPHDAPEKNEKGKSGVAFRHHPDAKNSASTNGGPPHSRDRTF